MRKFNRQQKLNNTVASVNLDFGAAAAKVAAVFEPGEYRIQVQSARVIQHNDNVLIALDLVELDTGTRVATAPLWVDGPRSDGGSLTAENQNLIARLLTLKALPTSGNVSELIPQLAGLEFDARLVLAKDNRTGRNFNVSPISTRPKGRDERRALHVRRVAQLVAERHWRPFPGRQTDKVPAMPGWSGLNLYEWDEASLLSTISDYQPPEDYCCCFAVQRQIVVIDTDIMDPEHAAFATALANDIFGHDPVGTDRLRTEVHHGFPYSRFN